jgi:hypothetical protein
MKALLFIYTLGTLADYWTTAWGIARGATEKNPWMASLIANHGIEYVLYAKIAALAFILFVVWQTVKHDERLSEAPGEPFNAGYRFVFAIIWLITLSQWLVVGNNLFWMRIAMALGL